MTEIKSTSPKWGPTTKLVAGLTIVAIVAALVVQFRVIIGPLILALLLSYLFYPVVAWLSRVTKISWRGSVTIIYLLVLILLIGLVTVTGFAVVQQLQSLIGFIQNNVNNVQSLVDNLTQQKFTFGPFQLDLARYDLQTIANQVLSAVQPILGQAGSLIGALATSAMVTIGWGLFVLIISYFILADSNRVSGELVQVEVPGYQADVNRLGLELGAVWNAFIRGQLIIILMIMMAYSVLLGVLGVRFAIGIAVMAGLAKFIPYLGPFVLWVVTVLVSYFQGGNYFGLQPLQYAILVVVAAMILDQIFDNVIGPRLMGKTLGVHPAVVLIAAIIAAQLIGLIGLILAAPTVATLKLVTGYVTRKLLDLDPWPKPFSPPQKMPAPWQPIVGRVKAWMQRRFRRSQE